MVQGIGREKIFEVHNVSITPARNMVGEYVVDCSCHEFCFQYADRTKARLAAHGHIIDKLNETNVEWNGEN